MGSFSTKLMLQAHFLVTPLPHPRTEIALSFPAVVSAYQIALLQQSGYVFAVAHHQPEVLLARPRCHPQSDQDTWRMVRI